CYPANNAHESVCPDAMSWIEKGKQHMDAAKLAYEQQLLTTALLLQLSKLQDRLATTRVLTCLGLLLMCLR
ncbi:MAG: hypothetical protein WCG32_05980, partial [Actinomycetes bacterium]